MKVGISVTCTICGNQKQPHGRSAAIGAHYCNEDECEGYKLKPFAGCLWPGETEDDFPYPHCNNAVTEYIRRPEEGQK